MNKVPPTSSPEISLANLELEKIFRDGTELEHQGKLDDAAIKRIDDQLKAASEKLDREMAERIAQINARYPLPEPDIQTTPVKLPKLLARLILGALFFVVAGLVLEVTLGDRFVFSHANAYRGAMPWMFFVLTPAFAALWFFRIKNDRYIRTRYPTAAIRWGVMFPLIAGMSSAMIVFAPLGWAALGGWVLGEPVSNLEARVVSIRFHDQGRKPIAELEVRGNSADINLRWRVTGQMPNAGDTLAVSGKSSMLGVYIDEVHLK